MKVPFKPYKAEDADIFTVDAIHQKFWKDFCDVCYPHFGFENEEDDERTYEQKYDTFQQCHNMLKEYFDWNEELMFKVNEEDLKRFKNAYSLFANLSTKDNATLPMLLVLLRMQQSIWNRLREDRRMMDYVYPRKYFLTYDNYKKYEIGSYEDLPSDEHIMNNIGDLEKRICDDLLNERKWDDGWVREIEDYCCHRTDSKEKDKIEWDVTVGELAQKLSGHVLRSFNYALHESFTKFECNVAKGSGDVVKAVVYRLFMTYQSSLPEVKTFFDDYPAHLCMSKMIQTREELINEFKQTKLGAHWFECILLPEGLEKVGKYLINHRDTISVEEESHFFYLLDEICIMTDILQGNISKYWLNVEFKDAEYIQRQKKETKNISHEANPVLDAIKEQTVLPKMSSNKATEYAELIENCFKFPNDFTRERVAVVVKEFYHGSAANLALIEIVLYDHGQLKKRNRHMAFLKALMAWGIIGKVDDEGIKKLSNGMAAKMKSLPPEGYKGWTDKGCVNDRGLCIDIGKQLGDTMRYGR